MVPIAYLSDRRTDAESRKIKKRIDAFIEESLSQYKQVFHIMGNHEYYHGIWEMVPKEFKEYWNKKAPQVTVLDKGSVQLSEGLRLWGGTLWTDFGDENPLFMNFVQKGLNDYHLISKFNSNPTPYSPRTLKLRAEDTYKAHLEYVQSLGEGLKFTDDRWVVMTHHAPSWKSIEDKYEGDINNYGYVSELDTFIEEHPNIHTWVHGHTHGSHDYSIGSSRVLCNPRGYSNPNSPNNPENENFNPFLTFEV